MKKTYSAIACLIVIMILSTIAIASADQILVTKVDQVTVKLDKNGNEYTRLLITENKTLEGIKYTDKTSIMCFQPLSNDVKSLKAGQTVKLIVKPQTYQGNQSYTAIALIK